MAADNMSDPALGGGQSRRNQGPMLGAIIGGLLVGAVAGAFLLAPRLGGAARSASGPAAHARAGASAEESGVAPTIYTIDNLVLNPAQTAGTRFLMASVALELADSSVEQVVRMRDAEVRDVILRTLGGKTIAELANIAQRDSLRDELQSRLAAKLIPGAIRRVYFPQFVIQ